jgi:hypothetical protein
MKASITIVIDTDMLHGMSDSYVAAMWHVAQANPADPFKDKAAGELAEVIGREIIRRFCRSVGPELWNHQGGHYDWGQFALAKKPEAKPLGIRIEDTTLA